MSQDPSLVPSAGGAVAPADARAGLFDIVIEFAGAWDAPLQSAFVAAAARIEAAVLGDLPDVALPSADGAAAVVDDLVIRAELPAMDGPGGMFGLSGPTLLRGDSLLPATAQMRFDAADAAALASQGAWNDVVLHEMLHCLGFGTLWAPKGLLVGAGYVGAAGLAEYAALGGAGPVPVEVTGGTGTAGLHWSEAAFGTELMTGWIGDAAPLSPLTVASLADLGYGLAPRQAWPVDALYA
ncbi:MAG: peptidase [Acetobacteraceae bacterium]|nr:peptidase [Acetobacteraceae bacterium]